MMKIITKGTPPDIKYTFTCRSCETVAIADKSEGRYVEDQRDGDAIVFICPVCGKEAWVNYNQHKGGW